MSALNFESKQPQAWRLPGRSDPRWPVAGLLGLYLLLGVTVLGFSRLPGQIAAIVLFCMGLDLALTRALRGRFVFPLSALITGLSLAILLNFSLGYYFLWFPAFAAIASKYLLTYKGRHVFNPSLFGICVCLLLDDGFVNLSPAYQWAGTAETALAMSVFIVTAALLFFVLRIGRTALVLSFLFFFALQTALRAYLMRHHIPAETLFVGTLTSAPFFLFTFFMITDPATSPAPRSLQILWGFLLAALDFVFHLKFSLYTFFFAALSLATLRFVYLHAKGALVAVRARAASPTPPAGPRPLPLGGYLLLALVGLAVWTIHAAGKPAVGLVDASELRFQAIPAERSGIHWEKSDVLNQVDPRLLHVAKWLLSVGDAVATADVDLDGDQDLFFTQPLKTKEFRGKLYLNAGDFRFRKTALPELERYLDDPKRYGLPGFALFFDHDNDGDQDLFVGFGYGQSRLFENRLRPTGRLEFRELDVPFLKANNTVALAANAFDFDRDGSLDLLLANAMAPYLVDYQERVRFSIFELPAPAYEGDRRMFHFMHHSWHNANNGGPNYLLLNERAPDGRRAYRALGSEIGLTETRWSLGVGTADLNDDGYTDLYIANDFGRDDAYINRGGRRLERVQGRFFEDVGLDTYKGMNVSMGDVDGNGRDDIYISNVHHALQAEGSLLWMNHTRPGARSFELRDRATQMGALNPNRFGWGAAIGDLDLDGRPDIVQANGMVSDEWDRRYDECIDYWYLNEKLARSGPEIHAFADEWADLRGACIYGNEADRVYLNYEGEQFEDVAMETGVRHRANTRGVALVDLDNDGDLDPVFTDQFGAPRLYENRLKPGRRWVGLRMIGNGVNCNRDAIGTKIHVRYKRDGKAESQYREIRHANGFSAQGDGRALFGLGRGRITDLQAEVRFCGGQPRVISPAPDRYQTVRQDALP